MSIKIEVIVLADGEVIKDRVFQLVETLRKCYRGLEVRVTEVGEIEGSRLDFLSLPAIIIEDLIKFEGFCPRVELVALALKELGVEKIDEGSEGG